MGMKRKAVTELFLLIIIIVVLNVIGSFVFTRLDLTSEKRFTLSSSTIEMAQNLKDEVLFKIYLTGNLPPEYKKLSSATVDLLNELRQYAPDKIQYELIDPSAQPDEKSRNEFYQQLAQKGLQPTNINESEKGQNTQRIIFPGALLVINNNEVPMQLLKSKMGVSKEEMVNNSVENIEYEIAYALNKIQVKESAKVAFLQGNGELDTKELYDAARLLGASYQCDTVVINSNLKALDDYKVLVIAKPDTAISDKDQFIIDQFIMKGGSVLWCVDEMNFNMDSLSKNTTNVAVPFELNLDEMLFAYGVRINKNLLMDLQAAPIPVVTGYVGNQPRQDFFPWYYYPLFSTDIKHPIVHNLNVIKGEFVSSIDTIETPEVQKTILLETSKASKEVMSPVRISLGILEQEPDKKVFNESRIPAAVLLEGKFKSAFAGRIPASIASSPEIKFSEKSVPTKMIVIGDGDIISSYVSKKGNVYPMGYDRFIDQQYGNRNFILNCVDYLTGNDKLLELRGKEIKLRLIDSKKKDLAYLPWMNLLLPIILVLLTGVIKYFLRKRKFAS